MKLISIDPSGSMYSVVAPVLGLISLGVTVQSKRNEIRKENESAERSIKQNIKKIRNYLRDAGEHFEEMTNVIKRVAIKYKNEFLEVKFRSGVHLILNDSEAKEYSAAKRDMDQALCQAMTWINGSVEQVLNANPQSASKFMEIVGVLEARINDLFSMEKTYEKVIEETLELIEILNQRLSEMSGNHF